jgi:hypothetical protein
MPISEPMPVSRVTLLRDLLVISLSVSGNWLPEKPEPQGVPVRAISIRD